MCVVELVITEKYDTVALELPDAVGSSFRARSDAGGVSWVERARAAATIKVTFGRAFIERFYSVLRAHVNMPRPPGDVKQLV
jgi:hypothetical protein